MKSAGQEPWQLVKCRKDRDGDLESQPFEFAISTQPDAITLTRRAPEPDIISLNDLIISTLAAASKPLKTDAIVAAGADRCGVSRTTICLALRSLQSAGHITSPVRGLWSLNTAGN